MKEEYKKWLSHQCNKHVNQVNNTCYSHVCMVRGGWRRGNKVDYDLSTCIPLEILKELEKAEEAAMNKQDKNKQGSS
jgi:hypothetical protein